MPVCFPATTDIYEGQTSVATGWNSRMIAIGGANTAKQEIELPILTAVVCKSKYGLHDRFNSTTQICVDETGSHAYTCPTDSGGSLVVEHTNGNWYLAGFMSWVSVFIYDEV